VSDGAITLRRDGAVAILTIDRPEKRNAMTVAMLQQLWEHTAVIEKDDSIRAVVLTGAGDKAFSAGGDLTELLPRLTEQGDDSLITPEPSVRFFSKVYKPMIAAVNGLCVAGGFELMLGTDIRIASSEAVFGLAEVKWGIIPAAGSIIRLPRQIPWVSAMQLILTGDTIDATRAREIGLVNEVVAREAVLDRALEVAHRIARNGPVAVQTAKRIAVDSLELEGPFRLESALNRIVLNSDDIRTGLAAFAERRDPEFEGH
jgi:enoyl-CoA hydratase